MDQLTAMRVFVRVVDLAGFAAAARSLGVSTAMVSKQIAALERRLGVALLARTTRRVAPTDAGLRYHAHCQDILAAVAEADAQASLQATTPTGCLRVTAPVEFGNRHLAPLLPTLLRRHPQLGVELDLSNRVVDLVEEGLDAAIRIAPALDTALHGRQVATSRLVAVAAPGYLRRHGTPRTPEQIANHATLSFALSMGTAWPFGRDGAERVVPVRPRMLSSSSEALRQAACAGAGIALLPTFLVGDDLAAGRLKRVLARWSNGALRIHVVHPHRRSQPARLRAFVDALLERFGEHPQRDPFLPAEP